jgi:hypothetical protein
MALSTTTTTPTGWAADARYQNYLAAQQIAGKPYTPYQGNMLAGMNPYETSAQQTLGNGWQYGQQAMGAAQNAAQQAAGYQPQQVQAGSVGTPQGTTMATGAVSAGPASWMPAADAGQSAWMSAANAGPASQMTAAQAQLAQMQAAQLNRGSIRDVTSKNFTDYDINAYMNPYTNTVVNNTLNDLSRQNDIVNNSTNARAAAAGAFGGSRQAVANSLNNENYLRESATAAGNLRNQAFNTASGLIMQDADRNLQGQGMNQQMDWNVGNLNTTNQQQSNLQNMLASNDMSKYNATNRQDASQYNAGANNQMAQYNASNLQQAAQQNMAAQNQRAEYNASNRQQAEQQNMAARNNMAQYNASNLQAANRDTANSFNNMAQFNAGQQTNNNQFNADLSLRGQALNQAAAQNAANTQITAANALNAMGMDQQRWNANNAQGQLSAGQMQRQYDQAQLTQQYNDWMAQQNYPRSQLDYLQSALGGYSSGSAESSPYYNNTAANMLAGGLGATQLASKLPGAINGLQAGYNALSGLWSGASAMPNAITDAGAMSASDLLADYAGGGNGSSWWDTATSWLR